jgi:hypothetical protein
MTLNLIIVNLPIRLAVTSTVAGITYFMGPNLIIVNLSIRLVVTSTVAGINVV